MNRAIPSDGSSRRFLRSVESVERLILPGPSWRAIGSLGGELPELGAIGRHGPGLRRSEEVDRQVGVLLRAENSGNRRE